MIVVVSYELNINYVERSNDNYKCLWVSQYSAKAERLGALSLTRLE